MSWYFYPDRFSSYEEYVDYLKEKGLAFEAPEGMYKTEQTMTQEEKQLLLKDICARLPYGVKFQGEDSNVYTLDAANYFALQVEDVVFKPYLRSMSSMTEEEKDELLNLRKEMNMHMHPWIDRILDFYLSHHLDWRGLILLGLALEAPEGMYKAKQ